GSPLMLPREELVGHLGADPGSLLLRYGCLPVQPVLDVVVGEPSGGLLHELGGVAPVDGEQASELRRLLRLGQVRAGIERGVLEAFGVGMATFAEQVPHLLLADLAARRKVERSQSGAPPASR